MQIPVLVERLPEGGFRVTAGAPFNFSATAKLQPEAVEKVRSHIKERIEAGAWIRQLDFPNLDNPLMAACGTLDPDDPLVQEWEAIMAENRRKADEDPNYP